LKTYSSLVEIQLDLKNGAITCQHLVEYYLDQIDRHHDLNAYIEVYGDEALKSAKEIDQKIVNGTAGELAGLVVGVKDLIAVGNHPVSGASAILKGYESPFTATAVQRLQDEDAIIIGRQNCDEFGMGSSNENSAYGPVKNGIDSNKVPGGSSGGSAVAVQMDMCQISLGTDTGGSVRQPAAFCGVIGLKPTYSRISRYGLLAYASSFDTVGVLGKSIDDVQKVLHFVQGADTNDSTAARETPKYDLKKSPYKVAFLGQGIQHEGLSKEMSDSMNLAMTKLSDQGNEVEVIDFDLLDYALPTYYVLTTAEASTNLSRYDGVRYGHRSVKGSDLEAMYKNTRTEGFGKEVLRRIMLGTFVLSEGYYDAYYTKAQKIRRLIKSQLQTVLETYDFVVLPTTPDCAFKLAEERSNPVEMYLEDLFTVLASVTGMPAISIPMGQKGELPLGLQIIGKEFDEDNLLSFSQYLLTLK